MQSETGPGKEYTFSGRASRIQSAGEPRKQSGFSFIQTDREDHRMTVEFGPAAGPLDRYAIKLGCCQNPACQCRVLDLVLDPIDQPQSALTIRFALVLDEREVESPSGFKAMGEALSARITEDDWEMAERVYDTLKSNVSEPADVSGLEIPFPDDVLDEPEALVAYQEVFRHAHDLQFEHEQQVWNVLELYCSNPDCSCTDTLLDFASRPNDDPGEKHVMEQKDVTQVLFNYKTGKFKVQQHGTAGSVTAGQLMAALETAFPDFKIRLERRQRVLRALHLKARGQSRASGPPPARRSGKIGRNERCPCGSGKKYKACCGR